MPNMIVVERDAVLRDILGIVFADWGYHSLCFAEEDAAIAYLETALLGQYVCFDYAPHAQRATRLFAYLCGDVAFRERHHFLLMTTLHPLPASLQEMLTRWHLPWVQKPFALATLHQVVADRMHTPECALAVR